MPGAQCTRSPVCAGGSKYAHRCSQRRHRKSPGIPHAMILRLMAYSPRRRIRLASVACELTTYPRPVGPTRLRRLDTSNGCQDHTLLPYASAPFVLHALTAHGETALRSVHAHDAAASTASHPNVRDDREPPLSFRVGWPKQDIDF